MPCLEKNAKDTIPVDEKRISKKDHEKKIYARYDRA
jgi:hypothetical protein